MSRINLISVKKNFIIIALIVIMLTSFANFNIIKSDDWWNNDWGYREQIIILNAGTSELINFPTYINLPKREGMQNDFDDLRFITIEGVILDYEIESFDATHADI